MSKFNVLFVGASWVNFGGAEGPWDHASWLQKKLEDQLNVVGIVDPDGISTSFTQNPFGDSSLYIRLTGETGAEEVIKFPGPDAFYSEMSAIVDAVDKQDKALIQSPHSGCGNDVRAG